MPRARKPIRRRGKNGHKGGRKAGHKAALDPERVLGALRGPSPWPATRLLGRLGAPPNALRGLRRLLRQLEQEGRAERVDGGWRRPRADGLIEAELHAVSARGARAVDDAGREWRVRDAEGANPGDRVLLSPRGRSRAELIERFPSQRDHWVGILRQQGKWFGIGPYRDDGDWFVRIARSDAGGAVVGEVVVAEPTARKGKRHSARDEPWARVSQRLGRPGDADADAAAVIWRHRLPVEFSAEAEREAAALGEPRASELGDRSDLRDCAFVTIDPASARDHDDAVCVEARGRGFRLWVAIADVAHFVAPGSAIDREARQRGNSVYFPDRAIPMLPERLSSDLCSLIPDVDRFAVVVELDISREGDVERSRFRPAVIRSRAKLSYEQAAEQMETDSGSGALASNLRRLHRVASRLRRRRLAAGSLDFELPQARFVLDERGHPVDAQPEPRGVAHRAIEEAMLAANRAVAHRLVEAEVEAVHRIHESPSPANLERLLIELAALGLLEGGASEALSARELALALERAVGSPAERWIHQLALRSMQRARYSARSEPHFALGFERYLHFTSPIRRYADLAVHRALHALLAGGRPALDRRQADAIAERCSYRERVAVTAEREMAQLLACVLLRDHLGERHEGSITGLASHGFYVTLDPWWVEGLVHVSRLAGYYELDANGRSLAGPGGRFALGDRVTVDIAAADPVSGRIDLELAKSSEGPARSKRSSRSQPAGKRAKRASRGRKRK